MTRYRLGIDIGGTFTDLVLLDLERQTLHTEKVLTTPQDLWQGIARGIQLTGVPLEDVEIAHGTTVGLNTFLQRRGARTGLVTTLGFRDAYEIGRGARPDMYNLFFRKPAPLIPRQHRLEVRERLDARGAVVTPLAEEDVLAAVEHFRAHGIRDIAVVFLHSYRNPDHERRAAEVLQEAYPEAVVSCSHELVREWREYERTSTTAINAYVRPQTGQYMERAMAALADGGYRRQFFVNQSSGGIVSAETARARPVVTLMSGPAGGVAASAEVGTASGFSNVIAFDMGGTSTDVAVITDGRPQLTADAKLDDHPISVAMVAIHSIGAGGGSVAFLDDVSALNVGPESAGSEPGPACYGRGGQRATVTDANLVLGRVAPSEFVPGGLQLDRRAAERAIIDTIGSPLGLSTRAAAAGVVRIVNLKMAMAVRAVTVQRGLDPKDFALFAFGGAGGAHACWIALELGIPQLVVPVASGQFSALGIALSDVRHDMVRTALARGEEIGAARLEALFAAVESEAREALEHEQVPDERMALQRSADVRYAGQEYTIAVQLPAGPLDDAAVAQLREDFHRLHEQTYGHASAQDPIEVVNVRVAALGRVPDLALPQLPAGEPTPAEAAYVETVQTCFDGEVEVDTKVWRRSALLAGNHITGPAIIADHGATTILPPGFDCIVDPGGQLVIDVPLSDGEVPADTTAAVVGP